LVFIGHSMGGLVIKKAYILARQFQEYETLARRVRTIFFLATPHRGADLAQLLTKILQIAPGPRPFVTDLHRNSLATQSINDEFPQHCQELQLYSFYETLPTSYGIGKSLVVDKDLATLGYPNERREYLNANHRNICKFVSPTDPNYLTLRNALASAIDGFRSHVVSNKRNLDSEQRRHLEDFLGISDAPEDEYMSLDELRMRGSCEWLTGKDSFRNWRDSKNGQIYWISAKPATGKSVLSGFVIKHLKDLNKDCSFYFFAHGDKVKSTLSSFLRSMAWQMGFMHPEILQKVLEIWAKDGQLAKADYRTIWRKLFLDGLLRVKLDRPQYWVIDALDECKSEFELVDLLLKVAEMCSVHIFLTSRNGFGIHKQMVQPKVQVISEQIRAKDTEADISLFLEANMNHLPSDNEESRQKLANKILDKSAGCFLWVSLVLQELKQVHTSADVRQVLEDVPSDMDELYARILASMSRASYGKALAKGILTWAVCSVRPLTTNELYHALQIDIRDTLDSVQKAITTSCGQLVYVDAHSRVQMVHQTARDFLLRPTITSEFAIDRKAGHTRLATTCLRYLNGNEMKGSTRRKLSASNINKERSPFVAYACNSFYEHIAQASSTDDEILFMMEKFLSSSNVLSWIEYLAQNSDLNRVIQTGKVLGNFLQRRSNHVSPLGKEVAVLDSWATDLVRLVTKFGMNLSTSPSSIHHLIPPFCPPETAPRRQFAGSSRGIAVLGLSATTWDDCLSTIVYPREQVSALACSDKYFAVALSSGKIMIYHEMTCQEVRTLQQKESARILQFGERGKVLASASMKTIHIWEIDPWEQLWSLDITHPCMSLAFADEDRLLLGALRNNQLIFWDLTTGVLRDSADWTNELEGQQAYAVRRPTTAAFSVALGLLAVVYRGQDILLWDLEQDGLYDTYGKDVGAVRSSRRGSSATVWSLLFSPAPTATLLAAAYSDGDLLLFDTSEGKVKESVSANAQTLASSPNGRTLASGDASGTIQLFDFETLKMLYRINSEEHGIKSLAFSSDNHRLFDIRGSHCRVWDPITLVRQDLDEEISDTTSVSTAPQEISLDDGKDVNLITALTCHTSSEVFFCGKEDGSVYVYETKSGWQSRKLFGHADGVSVTALFFDEESHVLSSADLSSRVMSHKLIRREKLWEAGETVFDHRTGTAVDQILSNKGHTRILVSSVDADTLWSPIASSSTIVEIISWEDRGPYRWARNPNNQEQLILITNTMARLYLWHTMQEMTGPEGILLEGAILPELFIRSITPCFSGTIIATVFAEFSAGPHGKSMLPLWNASDFTPQSEAAAPVPRYRYLTDKVEFLIGAYGQRLVFLHASGWICSAESQVLDMGSENSRYIRHFFLPADWLSTSGELMIEVLQNGDIVFVKRDEVAVIKRGLESNEDGSHPALGKRPSLTIPGP
jgi:WD40 repeat protein